MKKVVFTQDIGVSRETIEILLEKQNLSADWSLADGFRVDDPDRVVAVSTANIPLTAELMSEFKNLRTVSMSFTGYDHVDQAYCEQNSISIYNVPSYSTDSVAELAIGLAISLLRQIPKGDQEIRGGRWNENISCFELAGKTCGIIGTGTIGCRVAELLAAFKCNILGHSRTEKDSFKAYGGTYLALPEMLKQCDIVFVTAALTENTRNIISQEEFEIMKSSSYLVNVSRGPLVNRDAIIDAINNKKIAGIGLDVFDYEPLAEDDEMRSLKSAVLTPHVAYRTKEALERKASLTIENIERGLSGDVLNKVY